MKFRTEIKDLYYPIVLNPEKPVILVGSCFSDNIARKMRECEWNVFNEMGTLYNPLSIAKVMDMLLFHEEWTDVFSESVFQSDGVMHSWLLDSHFSRKSLDVMTEVVSEMRSKLFDMLDRSSALIVTFGTAWCYFLEGMDDYVVANCHKQPQSMFNRKRVPISMIVERWVDLISRIKIRWPQLNVIFTVSPVRHLKDGFEGNSRSKSTLILAVEEICNKILDGFYFPAYEIVCDDLRDYRFYGSDLVHPSDFAVEYIWEIFRKAFVDSRGEELLRQGNRRFKAANHRQIIPL